MGSNYKPPPRPLIPGAGKPLIQVTQSPAPALNMVNSPRPMAFGSSEKDKQPTLSFGANEKHTAYASVAVVAKKRRSVGLGFPVEELGKGGFVGLYDFQGTVGKGHFGVVKLATHALTKEKVAVKIIDKTKLEDETKARLYNEVRCMQLLRHPNIISLYEVAETPTQLYLILEYADGGDLFERLEKSNKFNEEMARKYFRQVLSALLFCHQLKIVHRDIKPENILFCGGSIKVSDFGMSTHFSPGEMMQTACGSLAYSAPELLLGDAYEAPAVDVWSLGVTLYIMLAGRLPFDDANPNEAVIRIMEARFDLDPLWSNEVKTLLSHMLVVDPRRRASLSDVKKSEWVQQGERWVDLDEAPEEQLTVEEHNEIMAKLSALNLDIEQVKGDLEANKPTYNVATYHLLRLQALRRRARRRSSTAGGLKPPQTTAKTLHKSPSVENPGGLLQKVLRSNIDKGQGMDDVESESMEGGPLPECNGTSMTRALSAENVSTAVAGEDGRGRFGKQPAADKSPGSWLNRLSVSRRKHAKTVSGPSPDTSPIDSRSTPQFGPITFNVTAPTADSEMVGSPRKRHSTTAAQQKEKEKEKEKEGGGRGSLFSFSPGRPFKRGQKNAPEPRRMSELTTADDPPPPSPKIQPPPPPPQPTTSIEPDKRASSRRASAEPAIKEESSESEGEGRHKPYSRVLSRIDSVDTDEWSGEEQDERERVQKADTIHENDDPEGEATTPNTRESQLQSQTKVPEETAQQQDNNNGGSAAVMESPVYVPPPTAKYGNVSTTSIGAPTRWSAPSAPTNAPELDSTLADSFPPAAERSMSEQLADGRKKKKGKTNAQCTIS